MTNRLAPLLLLGCATLAQPQVPVITPVRGLVLTATTFTQLLTNTHSSANYIYSDNYISLQAVAPDQLTYTFQIAVPTDQTLDSDVNKFRFTRKVWREDIEQATSMTVGYSSLDPEIYRGLTFAETSRRVITALKTNGESAFVLGGYSTAGRTGTGNVVLHSPVDYSRAYYHGTLHRVETDGVSLPVLVNGKRVNLPAVHAVVIST